MRSERSDFVDLSLIRWGGRVKDFEAMEQTRSWCIDESMFECFFGE